MSVGETYLTLQGWVGSDIKFKEVSDRVALASFRLGSTPRQFDRAKQTWIDRPTTWFTVECWRTLAENVNESLQRGQPVVVTGRLKTTEWVEEGQTKSRTVLDAFSVGHDLTRGTTTFSKNAPQAHLSEAPSTLDSEMRDLSTQAETDHAHGEPSPFTAEEIAASSAPAQEQQAA